MDIRTIEKLAIELEDKLSKEISGVEWQAGILVKKKLIELTGIAAIDGRRSTTRRLLLPEFVEATRDENIIIQIKEAFQSFLEKVTGVRGGVYQPKDSEEGEKQMKALTVVDAVEKKRKLETGGGNGY